MGNFTILTAKKCYGDKIKEQEAVEARQGRKENEKKIKFENQKENRKLQILA
jgi:hypothetical protein